jgi:hypothetical protein
MKGAQPPFTVAGLIGLRRCCGQHQKCQGEARGYTGPGAMGETMRH